MKFGSNAATFGKDLDAELNGARRVIRTFNEHLGSIETNSNARRQAVLTDLGAMSAEAKAVQRQITQLEADSRSVGVDPDVAQIRGIRDDVIRDLGGLADGLTKAMTAIADFAGIANTGTRRVRQSDSQRDYIDQNPGARVRTAAGTFATPGTPGTTPVISQRQLATMFQQAARYAAQPRTTPATTAPTPVAISSIPAATIDDAAFDRVVRAVQDNVTATEKVEASIDRVAAILTARGGAGAPEPEVDPETGITQLARLTKQQNSELSRAFRQILDVTRKEHGDDKAAALWKQLVAKQQAALASGGTIIPEGALDQPKGPSRRERQLDESIAKDTAALQTLRADLEQLAVAMQEGAANSDVFARKLAEIDAAERRLASNMKARADEETRAQQRERQRRAALREAQANAGLTESAEERRRKQAIRGQLELAANPDELRSRVGRGAGQMNSRDLVALARTLSSQGYSVDSGRLRDNGGSRLSNDELIRRIAAAGQQYLQSGRATAENLRVRRLEDSSTPGSGAQRLLGASELGRINRQFYEQMVRPGGGVSVSPEQAFELLGWDARTGGQAGRGTQRRGRSEVGAAIGDELRDLIPFAREVVEEFGQRRTQAARADAVSLLRRDPGFNPADDDYRVEGRGEQAQLDRRTVGSVLRAVREIDTMARHLRNLDNAVNAAEKEFTAAARAVSQGRNEGLSEASMKPLYARFNAALRGIETARGARDTGTANLRETMGPEVEQLLRSPEFQQGFRAREANSFQTRDPEDVDPSMRGLGRMSYDEAYRENQARRDRQRFAAREDLRAATFQALAGGRTFTTAHTTAQGNTKDFYSRLLPGLRSVGSEGRTRFAYENEEAMLSGPDGAKNARALRTMTAGVISYTRNLNQLIDEVADGESTEERLNETRAKVIRALERTFNAYQTAFPTQRGSGEGVGGVQDIRLFAPAELFGGSIDGLIDQTEGGVRRGARANQAQARRDQIEAEAQAAATAPGRAEALQRETLKSIRGRIRSLNEDLRDLRAERSRLGSERGSATKDLNKALGPKLRSDVADAEKLLAQYDRKLAKVGTLTDAEKKSRDIQQSRINAAYNASPMIQETKARRDAIDVLRAENAARIKLLEGDREAARGQRKRLSGRVDAKDIESAYADLEQGRVGGRGGTKLADAERRLATFTERAVEARKKLADLEAKIAGSLPPDLREGYTKQLGERAKVEQQMAALRNGPLLADTDETPGGADRRDRAQDEMGKLQRRLEGLNRALRETERYAGALNPNARTTRTTTSNTDRDLSEARKAAERARGVEGNQRAVVEGMRARLVEMQAEYDQMVAAFNAQQDRRGSKRAADPNVPGFGEGGAGDGGGDSTAQGGADEGGGGHLSILRQILARLNSIDTRLKGTLKVSGNVKTTRGSASEGTAEGAPTTRRQPPQREAPLRSSQQGRQDFFQSVAGDFPTVAHFAQVEDAAERSARGVAAATELITRGVMSETAVLQLFRDELQQNTAAARQFATQVRQSVGNQRLQGASSAAAEQRRREQEKLLQPRNAAGESTGAAYTTRDTGETITLKQARAAMREDMAERRRRAQEIRRSTSEERQATQAALAHAQTLRRLSDETRREIAELERQARAADNSAEAQERLVRQMAQVYGLAQRDLGIPTINATNQAVGGIFRGAGVDVTSQEVAGIRNTARDLGHQVDQTAANGVVPGGLFGEQSAFTRAMFGNTGFWSRVMNSTGTFIVRNFTAGFVFGLTNAMQEVIGEAIKTEATFIRVSHALEATGRSAGSLRGDLQAISTEYGSSLNDIYTVAAGLTGLFKTPQEIAGATEVVAQLEMISGGALNAQEAMGALASIQGAFGEELGQGIDGLTHVADVLTSVQNSLGTNVETTAEGVGRMSGLAQQLNLSFEEVAVYSAQIAKLTNQTGAAAGEQFSRILSVMQTGRGRQVLQDNLSEIKVTGPDGEFTGESVSTNIANQLGERDYSGVLRTLSQNWSKLTSEQQQNIATTIAGQRQAASFAALMNNGSQSLDAIRRAQESHNAAQERTQALMKTLNGQISILGANFQNLANNLVRSGILYWLGALLMATNFVLRGVNSLFSMINDFVDNTPFVGTLAKWTFALLSFLLVINLLKKSWAGLRATLAANPTAQNFQRGFQGPERMDRNGYPARLGYGPPASPIRDRFGAMFNQATSGPNSSVRRVENPGYRVLAREGQRDYQTGAFARGFGAVLNRTLGQPLERAGAGLNAFGNNLRQRAVQIGTLPLPMQTGTAQAAAQAAAAQRSAARMDLAGRIFSGGQQRTGFLGAFNGGLSGLLTGGIQGVRNFGTNQGFLQRSTDSLRAGQAQSRVASSSLRDLAARERAAGNEAAARQADRAARAQAGLGRIQGATAATTGRLSSSLQGLRGSGIGADAAMIGLSFALMAVFTSMQKTSEAAKVVNDVMEARAKAERAEKGKDEPYKGVAQEGYEQITKEFTDEGSSFMSGLNFVGESIGDLASGTAGVFTGGLVGNASDYAKPFVGETYNEMTGTTGGWSSDTTTGLEEAQKLYDEGLARMKEYQEQQSRTEEEMLKAAEEAATSNPPETTEDGRVILRPLGEAFSTAAEGIQVGLKEANDDLDARVKEIADNEGMSKQEKVAALANVEQARDLLRQQAEDLLAQSAGMEAASMLGLEQIKRVRDAMTNLQGLQGLGLGGTLNDGIQQLIGDTGVNEDTNPEIANYLNDLATGNVGAIEAAKGNADVIKELAKQAEIKYLSTIGSDPEVVEDARNEFITLMQQLSQLTDQQIQTFVGTANAIAESAYALGDFAGGRKALEDSIADLEDLRPDGTTVPGGWRVEEDGTRVRVRTTTTYSAPEEEQNLKIDAAIRQQRDQINQRTQFQRNRNLQLEQAGGLGEVAAARNNLAQAQNNLRVLQQARQEYGSLGATVQQIHDARLLVMQNQVTLAQAMLSGDLAGLALLAARSWSQAAKDGYAEQSALLQLQAAREEFGRGSVQAQQAYAAYINQQHTNQQNADSRAQAARDAQLAAIPQGNAVAVANQQVANAQAALAAAQKYGTDSTEYQSALAQLYAAQQQAMSAQNAVAIAQAQLGQAYAQARGDAVAAARAGANVARAQLAAALQASGGATSAEVLGAQAQLVAANEAIDDAQVALIQSRINVSIALAESAGHTVQAARLQIRVALAALNEATAGTAEYNQAKADVIRARAAARDAALQDQLDTIDFNLQMGRITQSAAIAALQQILRTQDLTKAQRRQLLLQIKGMKEEMADSQWNFGDITLPTPYQMRRYIKQQQQNMQKQMEPEYLGRQAAGAGMGMGTGMNGNVSTGAPVTNITNQTTITIDGTDIGKVEKVLRNVLGGNQRVNRTTGPRRGGN